MIAAPDRKTSADFYMAICSCVKNCDYGRREIICGMRIRMKNLEDIRETKYSRVYAEVDLDAIVRNAENMKKHVDGHTRLLGVIKTDGYGHGSIPIAKCLEPFEYMYGFAVATIEEAMALRKNGITKPVLILGYTFPYSYPLLAEYEIRPAVFRKDSLAELSRAGLACKKPIKVHIKVDTGMNRIGITPDDAGLSFVKEAMSYPGIIIEGIFTHFARADEADKTSAYGQLAKFEAFLSRIETELGLHIPLKHCSNSASIMEMPCANMDLVRPGIILYGLEPSNEVDMGKIPLQPALSLYSHIVMVKEIQPGASISYGGTFTADKPMMVATIPVGYGDGYPRALSGKGYVLIRGQKAPILGKVCMDQFMADITGIEGAVEGDKVTLLGHDGEEEITAQELGDLSGRFNYELICDLGKRIPRVYLKDGKVVQTAEMFQNSFL